MMPALAMARSAASTTPCLQPLSRSFHQRRSYTPATRCSTPLGRRRRLRAGESISSISSEVTATCGRDISTESRLAFLWTNPVFPFPICVRYLVRRVLRVRAVPASHGRGTGPGAVPGRAHAPIIVPLVPEGGAGGCPMTRRDQGRSEEHTSELQSRGHLVRR